jgi:hypothetical protein
VTGVSPRPQHHRTGWGDAGLRAPSCPPGSGPGPSHRAGPRQVPRSRRPEGTGDRAEPDADSAAELTRGRGSGEDLGPATAGAAQFQQHRPPTPFPRPQHSPFPGLRGLPASSLQLLRSLEVTAQQRRSRHAPLGHPDRVANLRLRRRKDSRIVQHGGGGVGGYRRF